MPALTDDDVGQKALESAGDFIKVTTGLATGALVFSVTLLNNPSALSGSARGFLFGCWAALLVSIFAAVIIAQGRVTTKIAEKNYDIHSDLWLTVPTIVHQWTFFAGIVALGATLFIVLAGQPSTSILRVKATSQAVRLALEQLPRAARIVKIDSADLVKGTSIIRSERLNDFR